MNQHLRNLTHRLSLILSALCIALAAGLTSCDSVIYDDLDPCPQGLVIRFVYDYNMEFANAFPSQVDCLTVLFYDSEGRYVHTETVSDAALLSDENWRLTVDLAPGDYTILAYGGMLCSQSSFSFNAVPAAGSLMTDLTVSLNPALLTSPAGTQLHPLFYGRLSAAIESTDTERREVTVPMMKDTNNLRILLQNVDGTPCLDTDFNYTLTAENTQMNWQNALLPVSEVTYMPWARGQATAGTVASGTENVLAFAEFSSSRFVAGSPLTLTITRATDGSTVLRIPLIDYLLLLKSQEFSDMGSQEFLDRESRWNMIFLLDSNQHWLKTTIVINDWVVRINDINV
ncbi:MAG: FimB/Mfa2 family fimbrial subunit [Paramuribaculum sp.]|nr:FimB/Mfa2 family fimbrial subunit [Paramuribaculum sp.]